MAATADEEARRLDKKIAEIRRKNEAILKRRKEIEEDKKLAEQQNAVVQLRPSTEDWPRERTPALRPSKRDIAGDESFYSPHQDTPPSRASGRRDRPGTTSSRGQDLMEKGAGPPPDPRSFLFDPDRDYSVDSSRERSERVRKDSGQEFNRGRGGSQREKYDQHGQRERGGARSSRGGGRDGDFDGRRNRGDEAWRVERHKIDEARIQRQKDADGRWRREWDNEKLTFELEGDDNKHPALTPAPKSSTPSKSVTGRLSQWKTSVSKGAEGDRNTFNRQIRDSDQVQGSGLPRFSAPKASSDRLGNASPEKSNTIRFPKYEPDVPISGRMVSRERTVLTESENVKITIKNKESGRKEDDCGGILKGGKVRSERRTKKRSEILRTSQSSVSDEDASSPSSPSKFTQYENMTFTIKNEPVNIKRSDLEKMSYEEFVKLSKVAKPPLPPFRLSTKKMTPTFLQNKEKEHDDDDDDSWEDVTTSGTESLYESGPESLVGTPLKAQKNTEAVHHPQTVAYTPDDFICLVPPEPQSTTSIINQIPLQPPSNVEEIINESIVLVPPNFNAEALTSNMFATPPPPYQPVNVGDLETGTNHSFNVDNYIVLVKPDTSFEEVVQQEHLNAQSGTLQQNYNDDSTTVLPKQ